MVPVRFQTKFKADERSVLKTENRYGMG